MSIPALDHQPGVQVGVHAAQHGIVDVGRDDVGDAVRLEDGKQVAQQRSSGASVESGSEALPLKRNAETAMLTPGSFITGGAATAAGGTRSRSFGATFDGWAGRRNGSSVCVQTR